MQETISLKISQRGVLTLPKTLRTCYNLRAGDNLTLLDLGGVFILTPKQSEIDALADRITDKMHKNGETLDSMLTALRDEREKYGDRDR